MSCESTRHGRAVLLRNGRPCAPSVRVSIKYFNQRWDEDFLSRRIYVLSREGITMGVPVGVRNSRRLSLALIVIAVLVLGSTGTVIYYALTALAGRTDQIEKELTGG